MKPLKDHILVYDGDCPMCRMYSNGFIKSNMLDDDGIVPFNDIREEISSCIDMDKARNEIALVDRNHQTVTYGIESWFKIVGNSFPAFQPLFRFPVFYRFMKSVYSFISYNRKVIAPGKSFNKAGTCYPDYHIGWRWSYILVTSVLIAFLLNRYFVQIPLYRNAQFSFVHEWFIVMGQLLFQGSIVFFSRRDRILHYFGHLMTISMIGSLLLLPIILLNRIWKDLPVEFYMGYFIIPVSVMIWQHIRRTKLVGIQWFLTVTWILYRVILLVVFAIITNNFTAWVKSS